LRLGLRGGRLREQTPDSSRVKLLGIAPERRGQVSQYRQGRGGLQLVRWTEYFAGIKAVKSLWPKYAEKNMDKK